MRRRRPLLDCLLSATAACVVGCVSGAYDPQMNEAGGDTSQQSPGAGGAPGSVNDGEGKPSQSGGSPASSGASGGTTSPTAGQPGKSNGTPEATPSCGTGQLPECAAPGAWSRTPPKGLAPQQIPQFVAITYDDNFAPDGMTWVTNFYNGRVNPPGNGNARTFDGAPIRTSFYHTSSYIENSTENRSAWRQAVSAGHEAADHTRSHADGIAYSLQDWLNAVTACRNQLTNPETGIGVSVADVIGFRSPFLNYNDQLFEALSGEDFVYDTSIENCWGDDETGKNCSFPHLLDSGSKDADVLSQKFKRPHILAHAGLWEVPVSALIVPDDSLAAQYDFQEGLRSRIPTTQSYAPYYEPASGKIAPLDITLFVDAKLSARDVLAILKYNLDLHLSGNRAPFVYVAHTHVYADEYPAAVNAVSAADRRDVIAKFTEYALTKPEVRHVPVRDIVAWMKDPVPLAQ